MMGLPRHGDHGNGRGSWILSKTQSGGDAIHFWHRNIHEDHIGRPFGRTRNRVLPIHRLLCFEALRCKIRGEQVTSV